MAQDPRDGALFVSTFAGVFRSTDGGQVWEAVSAGLANWDVWALVFDQHDGTLFAGTEWGVFRSTDKGRSWETVHTRVDVKALVVDSRDGALFAGTNGTGVLRSVDKGWNWGTVNVGLSDTRVRTMTLDPQNGTLFAGTKGGVFRSNNRAQSWEAANTGLTSTNINVLTFDSRNEILYAGTDGGVFSSPDRGQTWKKIKDDLTFTFSLGLQDKVLFAGTVNGVFRSVDGGQSWEVISSGLTHTYINVIFVDQSTGVLFTGTGGGGLFRSVNSGESWASVNNGLTNLDARGLYFNQKTEVLFISTSNGLFRSIDGGKSWEAASAGFAATRVYAMTVDPRDDTLFAATDEPSDGMVESLYRSINEGRSWEAIGGDIAGTGINAIVLNYLDGTLFAGTADGGVFRSIDRGQSWQVTSLKIGNIADLALDSQDGVLYASTYVNGVFRSLDGGQNWDRMYLLRYSDVLGNQVSHPVWSYDSSSRSLAILSYPGGNPIPIRRSIDFYSVATRPTSANELEFITTHGATLSKTRMDITPYINGVSWWLIFCGWTNALLRFTIENWIIVAISFSSVVILFILVAYGVAYTTWAHPYKVSLAKFLRVFPWYPAKMVDFAWPILEQMWPTWRKLIRKSLLYWDEVVPADLRSIPSPYRHWALQRYMTENKESEAIVLQQDRLQLLARGGPRIWLNSWAICAQELKETAGLTETSLSAVNQMASMLVEALKFKNLSILQTWPTLKAYSVEAPTLRLGVPLSFPLIFLGDPGPNAETIKLLTDCVDTLRQTTYFALIVPLEPAQLKVNIPTELRQWLRSSERVDDFIILSLNNVLDIISARDPISMLVQQIITQVDLRAISPFKDKGPCPVNMFFGREREIKQIVDNIRRSDFAIVGNRKAGKTSLLQRVEAKLSSDSFIHPLFINCQNVRDSKGFYREFESASSLSLPNYTPEAFEQVLRQLNINGRFPVLLIDEVDKLLRSDYQENEDLSGIWRKLAQDEVCHFVFVGTATLAGRLRDPKSVFFNFPQSVYLKYLPTEIARQVIIQPLDALGLMLEPKDELVERIVDLSSGHPNLLQTLGRRLVDRISDQKKRIITIETFQTIANTNDFTNFYLDLIWGVVQPLEKLITLIAPDNCFELQDIESNLRTYDIPFEPEDVDSALEVLEVYAILKRENRLFSFNPTHFQEILRRTQDVDRLIHLEKRKFTKKKQETSS